MSNKERQAKWLEKNRAAFNLRRRNKRKGLVLNPEYEKATHEMEVHLRAPVGSKAETLAHLRDLMANPIPAEPEAPAKPVVYRNDYGAIITESAWNKLQEMKKKASENGYEIDEFSQ